MRRGGVIALLAVAAAVVATGAGAGNINTDVVIPDAEVNAPLEFVFEVLEGCGPYHFSVSEGALPPGFRLLPDGRLLGAGTQAGTFTFTVSVDDRAPECPSEPLRGVFTMDVLPDLAITTETLPVAKIGEPYTATVAVSGRDATVAIWTIAEGALPPGLQLGQDGKITGTPTSAGSAGFVVKIEEPFRRKDLRYLLLPVASPLAASSIPPRFGELGIPFSARLGQTGGVAPVRWTAVQGSLPFGLTLDRATGVITGRPLAAGASQVTFRATDATGTTSETTVLFRLARRLQIGTVRLASALSGSPYAARLRARGGVGPVRWRVVRGTLPQGIRLDAAGRFSGRSGEPGTYRLTVRATDALGASSTARVTLRVV